MKGIIAQKLLLRDKIKKVLSHAHVHLLEQRARNAHDQNEQTLYLFLKICSGRQLRTLSQVPIWHM